MHYEKSSNVKSPKFACAARHLQKKTAIQHIDKNINHQWVHKCKVQKLTHFWYVYLNLGGIIFVVDIRIHNYTNKYNTDRKDYENKLNVNFTRSQARSAGPRQSLKPLLLDVSAPFLNFLASSIFMAEYNGDLLTRSNYNFWRLSARTIGIASSFSQFLSARHLSRGKWWPVASQSTKSVCSMQRILRWRKPPSAASHLIPTNALCFSFRTSSVSNIPNMDIWVQSKQVLNNVRLLNFGGNSYGFGRLGNRPSKGRRGNGSLTNSSLSRFFNFAKPPASTSVTIRSRIPKFFRPQALSKYSSVQLWGEIVPSVWSFCPPLFPSWEEWTMHFSQDASVPPSSIYRLWCQERVMLSQLLEFGASKGWQLHWEGFQNR